MSITQGAQVKVSVKMWKTKIDHSMWEVRGMRPTLTQRKENIILIFVMLRKPDDTLRL